MCIRDRPTDVLSIKVKDSCGAELKNAQINRDGIDVSMLKAGVYMVQIQTSHSTFVERVIKYERAL
jgi:hypothetical protein